MTITGTHFNYYQLCHRKLWLFANGINMEQESDLVYEGKLVHESSKRKGLAITSLFQQIFLFYHTTYTAFTLPPTLLRLYS